MSQFARQTQQVLSNSANQQAPCIVEPIGICPGIWPGYKLVGCMPIAGIIPCYIWHDVFICVTCNTYMWCDSFICVTNQRESEAYHMYMTYNPCDTWLIHMRDTIHVRDSVFVYACMCVCVCMCHTLTKQFTTHRTTHLGRRCLPFHLHAWRECVYVCVWVRVFANVCNHYQSWNVRKRACWWEEIEVCTRECARGSSCTWGRSGSFCGWGEVELDVNARMCMSVRA